MQEAERLMEENVINSVEKEVTGKELDITCNIVQGCLKLREIITLSIERENKNIKNCK